LNLTPCEPQTPCVWHFVLCCAERRNARGATFAHLAGKRAFRLGFARLSAPCSLREPRRRGQSLALSNKKRTPSGVLFCLAEKKGFEPYSFANRKRLAFGTSCYVAPKGATLAEQPSLASLESKLSDSASLGYLRRARFASLGAGVKALLCQTKKGHQVGAT